MIRTENLSVCYGDVPAVRDISLTVTQGEVLAIVGPSGCGKSSFLWALNRMTDLVSAARVTGRVLVDGRDVYDSRFEVTELRRSMGLIFQKPNPFAMSIRENIQLALREQGAGRAAREECTRRVLADVGLWEEVHGRLGQSAQTLSGGQQQRLCIARALALQPRMLLLDEPCSALDPLSAATVESLITSLRGRLTIVIVTHNLAQARRISDSLAVFWMRDGAGALIETGRTETLFANPSHPITRAYLSGAQG